MESLPHFRAVFGETCRQLDRLPNFRALFGETCRQLDRLPNESASPERIAPSDAKPEAGVH